MVDETKRPLKVFLCHASGDKPVVRELYKRLTAEGVDAWLDQEKLLPGQDWRVEIPRAVREADVVVICLSNKSITKEGYVQKEIRFALDSAEEKPEGTIFLIPARLEDCIVPERLDRWQWVDLFEENGFLRLLRSLKLRADKVGVVIEPSANEDADSEVEHRLDQLYTEGLAAFWVEDWDRACQRFQAILRERPSHKNAADKLAQAERQRSLSKLYAKATTAYESKNWVDAVKALEELLEKSADYKDAVQLLKEARKQRHLDELYTEAKRLHAAQKWQAVLKVFEQITVIEPSYLDPENLLPFAQQEAAELKRQADLNELYRQGVHQMDAGEWYEARRLLEQVHKTQTGFLDTERLLRKVENEIIRLEELKQRNNQINTLYEQAHGLIRSRSWRMALNKIEEIQRLDDQFLDKDGIAEKARAELEREEQIAQQQNELAAMYAESVRLLKEGKYQQALDKWHEVKKLDLKYPDRQRVQSVASKWLQDIEKPLHKPRIVIPKPLWIGAIGLIVVAAMIAGVVFSHKGIQATPSPTVTGSSGNIVAAPTMTTVPMTTAPSATRTSQSSATSPPQTVADPLMYDDFDNATYDGRFNAALWVSGDIYNGKIVQGNGVLTIGLNQYQNRDIGLGSSQLYKPTSPIFVESKIMLDPASRDVAAIYTGFGTSNGGSTCAISSNAKGEQQIYCVSVYFEIAQRAYIRGITAGTWHVIRLELYPNTMTFIYLVDGEKIGSYIPRNTDQLKDLSYSAMARVNSGLDTTPNVLGYADYVKTGKIEESEMKQTAYRWDFGNSTEGWGDEFHYDMRAPNVQDGYLILDSTGTDPYISSPVSLNISPSQTPVVTVRMRVVNGQGTSGIIFFITSQDADWGGEKLVEFPIMADGAFHLYNILMSINPAWKGAITEIRFDPVDDPTASNIEFAIDYISVHAP